MTRNRLSHRLPLILLIFLSLSLFVASVAAQGGLRIGFDRAGETDQSPEINDADFPQLNLTFTPLNDSGVPISGLTGGNFTILDGGEPVKNFTVTEWTDPNQGISVVLVFDVSGSMLDDIDALRAAAATLFDDVLAPGDETAIITFSTQADGTTINLSDPFPQITSGREVNFTNDEGMLKNLINGLVINEGDGTPLYDAIYKGARLARKDATNDRRVVIVMTDGVDSDRQGNVEKGSTIYDRNSIIEELRQLNVPVFTVGLGDEIDSAFLQRVANTTGGTYQNAPQGSDLARIFTEVAAGLKIKYDLGLESRTVSDGGLHNLTIEARTPFGDVSGSTQYLANYPIVPWVQGVQAANPRQDFRALDTFESVKGRVILQPRIVARDDIIGVDYYVNDKLAYTATASPWEFTWDTSNLAPNENHTLRIEARDVANPPNVGGTQFNLLVEECNLLCRLEESTGINPMYLLFVLIALLALFVLFMAMRRRKPAAESFDTYAPAYPYTPPAAPEPPAAPPTKPLSPTINVAASDYAPVEARPRAKTEVINRRQGPIAFLIDKDTGRQFQIDDQTTIGSGPGNDVVLDDSTVSGQHAKVRLEDGKLALFDLASTNGTEVNGNRIAHQVLADGDTVRLGRKTLMVKII